MTSDCLPPCRLVFGLGSRIGRPGASACRGGAGAWHGRAQLSVFQRARLNDFLGVIFEAKNQLILGPDFWSQKRHRKSGKILAQNLESRVEMAISHTIGSRRVFMTINLRRHWFDL